MLSKICSCSYSTMRNSKPSTTFDSCYNAIILQYDYTLKKLDIDVKTTGGQDKLDNKMMRNFQKDYPDIARLMQKESEDDDARKFLFTGEIVSQKQLPNGEVEIILSNRDTKERQSFKSKNLIYDPREHDKNTLVYEVTVEYEIIKDPITHKDEFYIKENSLQKGISIEKAQ